MRSKKRSKAKSQVETSRFNSNASPPTKRYREQRDDCSSLSIAQTEMSCTQRKNDRNGSSPTVQSYFPKQQILNCYKLKIDKPKRTGSNMKLLHDLPEVLSNLSLDSINDMWTQRAIDTAKIFRGVKVDEKGAIIRNKRRSRSKRSKSHHHKAKTKISAQVSKIESAVHIADEQCHKNNKGHIKKGKMKIELMCPIKEYYDMKVMLYDGGRKLCTKK